MLAALLAAAAIAAWAPAAQADAVHFWGKAPCGGGPVAVSTEPMPSSYIARNWINGGRCSVVYNPHRRLTWLTFCTAMAHEYGHLLGHKHSRFAWSIMYPYIVRPTQECLTSTGSHAKVRVAVKGWQTDHRLSRDYKQTR